MRVLTVGLLLCCVLGAAAEPGSLQAEDAWVRAAPPGVTMLAGYLTLRNTGEAPVRLTGVSSPDFARVELHRSVLEDGLARMRPVDGLVLPAGGEVRLEPGGYHLMLIQPVRTLAPGDSVQLRLRFSDGTDLRVNARLRRAAPDHHPHQRHGA